MSKRLENESAIVTGGARGIGRAIAERFASEGAGVLIADVDVDAATETAQAIEAKGGQAFPIRVDVTDGAMVEAAVQEAVARWGRLDIMMSNAGVMDRMPFLEMTEAFWARVLNINLTGAFLCGQAAARQMRRQESGGRIVFTASNSGVFGGRGRAAYGASKAGIINLVQTMAIELAAYGIRVNAVAPGPTRTSERQPDELWPSVKMRMPLGRYGRPEEIAAVAAFLAAPESSFVTGHVYCADGGYTAAGLMEG